MPPGDVVIGPGLGIGIREAALEGALDVPRLGVVMSRSLPSLKMSEEGSSAAPVRQIDRGGRHTLTVDVVVERPALCRHACRLVRCWLAGGWVPFRPEDADGRKLRFERAHPLVPAPCCIPSSVYTWWSPGNTLYLAYASAASCSCTRCQPLATSWPGPGYLSTQRQTASLV
jgi:hypothetical protein